MFVYFSFNSDHLFKSLVLPICYILTWVLAMLFILLHVTERVFCDNMTLMIMSVFLQEVYVHILDLCETRKVWEFAEAFKKRYKTLNVLVSDLPSFSPYSYKECSNELTFFCIVFYCDTADQ